MGRRRLPEPELWERLNRARMRQRELNALRERVEYWRAEAERCTASYGPGEPGSGGAADRRAELVARIVDAEREIQDRVAEITGAEREALELIYRLEDERLRTILLYRYVDNLSWPEIADKMHYCREYIVRLHRQAIDQLVIDCHTHPVV